ncbi:MAG: glucose 1-dehydrogenase [Pseudomonadales bacterium]|nr:glucose 1-dehydrogenase [Pseudomonadales bacterium]
MDRVAGKIAIITGGARGLGAASAKRLAEEGAAVMLTDLREELGQQTVAAINEAGGKAAFMKHDTAKEDQWIEVLQATQTQFGGVDILLNNAGIGTGGRIDKMKLSDWQHLMSINMDGVFLGMKHCIPAMRERASKWEGGGTIINISSIMGFIGAVGSTSYCASKGGVRIATKAAALECAKLGFNIRVNSIHPGYMETEGLQSAMRAIAKTSGDEAKEAARQDMINSTPIGRLGKPKDIANGVLFLASDDASFVTGTELVIDGGVLAQ